MVHIPTFKTTEREPEVFLAMCALGAGFRHENRKAVLLFHTAKQILQRKAREKEELETEKVSRTAEGNINYSH